jgi:hypothetical protein
MDPDRRSLFDDLVGASKNEGGTVDLSDRKIGPVEGEP